MKIIFLVRPRIFPMRALLSALTCVDACACGAVGPPAERCACSRLLPVHALNSLRDRDETRGAFPVAPTSTIELSLFSSALSCAKLVSTYNKGTSLRMDDDP